MPYPQDKTKNASGQRRSLELTQEALSKVDSDDSLSKPNTGDSIPPLLKKIMADYAATGLPLTFTHIFKQTNKTVHFLWTVNGWLFIFHYFIFDQQ